MMSATSPLDLRSSSNPAWSLKLRHWRCHGRQLSDNAEFTERRPLRESRMIAADTDGFRMTERWAKSRHTLARDATEDADALMR